MTHRMVAFIAPALLSVFACVTFVPGVGAQSIAPRQASAPQLRINTEANVPALQDFVIAPTRSVITLNPGESRTIDVQLLNRASGETTYSFSTEDFIADPENDGLPSFFTDNRDGPYPARLWIKPEASEVTLEQGQRLFMRLTITAPFDADPGDHQAALIVTRNNAASAKSGFAVVSRVASLFIIHVPGDIIQDGDTLSLTPHRWFNWWLPVRMSLSFRNDGSVYLMPEGSVEIRNIFGILVDEIPLKDWIVLRNSTRTKILEWSPAFALGRYTARTNLTGFEGTRELTQIQTSFWVLPLLPVLIALLAIFLVSFLVQYFFSRFELKRKDR